MNEKTINILFDLLKTQLLADTAYTSNDIDAFELMSEKLFKWNKICHKYRHGKKEVEHRKVPPPLFDYIFSEGVNLYRFLLDMDMNYNLRSR